uniref:O-antigen ligase family protein n=1 Tax=Gelidibacter sp. TaxID=2018083 RepID=UPI0040497B67
MKTATSYIAIVGFHVALGILIYLNETLSKFYFFAAFVFFLYRIIVAHNDSKTFEILKACAYFVGAEVFFRTTKGAISYEAGKYLVILLMLLGMFYKGLSGKGYPYFIYMMFLIPSIFVASTTLSFDVNFRTNIAFVLSGPICLGIAALFCYDKKVSQEQLSTILLYMMLPILAHTAYLFLYTPDLEEVLSGTGSNREASGGWGANQVSTALGIGMLVLTMRLFSKSPGLILKLINIGLLGLVSFRAVVTFSRGGVIAAFMTIAAFLIIYYTKVTSKKKNEILIVFLLFSFSMAATWVITSNQTAGLIDLRYANKDHLGREKQDLSTGRGELFMNEIEGFLNNPFFGIGSSRAKDQRIEVDGQGVTSHSEVSRTLSEHGMFGIAMLLILLIKPFDFRAQNKQNVYFYAFMVFWFATINHSSMRIAAPAFIYGLALLNVTYEKTPLHRKSLAKQAR